MGEKLSKISASLGIPEKSIDWKLYMNANRSEEKIIDAMLDIDDCLRQEVIVMGGMCANSHILGHRPMRKASNDLDCILLNERGVYSLYSLFRNSLFKTESFGDLFLDYNGIPVGFDLEYTHGWKIPEQFFKDVVRFNFDKGGLNSISPEFLITLKAKRSISKEKFYGKDAVDTVNILIAPSYKQNLDKINYNKIGYLMKQYASNSTDELNKYIDFIEVKGRNPLKKKEIPIFDECLSNLRDSI